MDTALLNKRIQDVIIRDGTIWEENIARETATARIVDFIKAIHGSLPNTIPDRWFLDAVFMVISEGG